MGVCCVNEDAQVNQPNVPKSGNQPKVTTESPKQGKKVKAEPEKPKPLVIKEIDPPSMTWVSDKYKIYEATLPFCRVDLEVMNKQIDVAEEACGGQGFVTLQAFHKALPAPSFKDLSNPDSNLAKMLLSEQFKDSEKGTGEDQIDVDSLKIFALLHCSAKNEVRAVAFYNILQEGGLTAHTQISAQDKDFAPAFAKIVKYATATIFEWAQKDGADVESPAYSEEEIAKLLNDENVEILREDHWLDDVYGHGSRLDNDQWLEKVAKGGFWLIDPTACRDKAFETASIDKRH